MEPLLTSTTVMDVVSPTQEEAAAKAPLRCRTKKKPLFLQAPQSVDWEEKAAKIAGESEDDRWMTQGLRNCEGV